MVGKKLLVADDSLTIQKVIRLALSNEGYEIKNVSDGHDALSQISVFRPDLVLIDAGLPGRSAFEVKRSTLEAMQGGREPRFILMSSAFEKVDEALVAATQFSGRLTKPFDPAHLREVLLQALASAPISSSAHGSAERTSTHDADADIRSLTESTIRMSGLAEIDTETSTRESGGRGLPDFARSPEALAPSASLGGMFGATAGAVSGASSAARAASDDDFGWSVSEASRRQDAFEPVLKPHASFADFESEFASPEPVNNPAAPAPSAFEPADNEPSELGLAVSGAIDPDLLQRTIEQTIRSQLERLLPDVAERIIKQEIHRMLEERP